MNRTTIEKRVEQVAESALYNQFYVCPIDIFLGLGWLQPSHVKEWKQGRVFCLEKVIHAAPPKVSFAMKCFRSWIHKKGLKGSQTFYRRHTKGPKTELQFSLSGNPQIERFYSTHYVSPLLSATKQKTLQTKLEKPPELPVFIITNDAQCFRCQQKLPKGNFLFKEVNQALCLTCAQLDHLVFLPSGDVKLTRETKKQSTSHFVVLKFSSARGHYERQGLLVEQEALDKAKELIASLHEKAKEEKTQQSLGPQN